MITACACVGNSIFFSKVVWWLSSPECFSKGISKPLINENYYAPMVASVCYSLSLRTLNHRSINEITLHSTTSDIYHRWCSLQSDQNTFDHNQHSQSQVWRHLTGLVTTSPRAGRT